MNKIRVQEGNVAVSVMIGVPYVDAEKTGGRGTEPKSKMH